MVVMKVKRDTNGGLKYLRNAIEYLENDEKSLFTAGFGVNPNIIEDTFKHMVKVREYFSKVSGNPMIHFIISFDENVVTANDAILLASQISQFFDNDYQNLWCIHFKQHGCSNFHMHLVINSVNYNHGKMYHSSYDEVQRFADYVAMITNRKVRWLFE